MEGGRRELDPHLADESEDLLGGGAGGEARGQEAEVRRGERNRRQRREAEIPKASLTDLPGVAIRFDLLVVDANGAIAESTTVGANEGHVMVMFPLHEEPFPRE